MDTQRFRSGPFFSLQKPPTQNITEFLQQVDFSSWFYPIVCLYNDPNVKLKCIERNVKIGFITKFLLEIDNWQLQLMLKNPSTHLQISNAADPKIPTRRKPSFSQFNSFCGTSRNGWEHCIYKWFWDQAISQLQYWKRFRINHVKLYQHITTLAFN